jgi:hypothetical protein
LIAMTVFAFACGGTKPKPESSLVEGADTVPSCCCKTLPTTAEKEIVPDHSMKERMECSAAKGDCVDDVQCTGQEGGTMQEAQPSDGNPPPPPVLEPSTTGIE